MTIRITYFVHGTTTDNEKDIAKGWNDGKLSELGLKQAKELGKLVSDKKFDVIFCSDLKRAVDSAKLGFNKYKIIKDKRLRECDYGKFTGKPDKIKDKMTDFIYKPFAGGESYQDVEKRMSGFLEFLKEKYDGRHVAVVAHQAPQLAMDVLVKKVTWRQAIDQDWRKKKAWRPGWEYTLK